MTPASLPPACWALLAAAVALYPLPTAAVARVRRLVVTDSADAPAVPLASRWSVRVDARTAIILTAGGAGLAVAALRGPALGIATAVLVTALAVVLRGRLRNRTATRRRRELLLAIRLLVGELEAGAGLASALTAAAGASTEHAEVFAAAARESASGRPAHGVLALGGAEYASLAHAWSVAEAAGVPLVAALTSVVGDLGARDEQARDVAVALAGARSSALLVAGLPVLGIALGATMGARPLSFLIDSPAGRLLCSVGVLLDAAGIAWTQHIIGRAARA